MKEVLKNRTKKFAIDVWRMCENMPNTRGYDALCNELMRSSGAVGSYFRAACRAKSEAEFTSKLRIVEDELHESIYVLEMLKAVNGQRNEQIPGLYAEANELMSIVVASIRALKNRNSKVLSPA